MARILCVDDEPNVVALKCAILESAGHVVTTATSAHDAIAKLSHDIYDAVVTDWRLGDANGRADLYLEKPVNPDELVTIVNELLKTGEKAAS
jgi:DNA-binding response OmpR family regulator